MFDPTEYKRLSALSSYDLDYTIKDPELEVLAKLAAQICNARISLVNIIDRSTQWSVASSGSDIDQMPREDSVCQRTIETSSGYEIKSLSKDADLADKFYVIDGPKLDYYYGVPLQTANGERLGALCVLDSDDLSLSSKQKESLGYLSELVVGRLEAIKLNNEKDEKLNEAQKDKRKLAHDIRGPVGGIAGVCEILREDLKAHLTAESIELFELIQEGSQSVLELSESILNVEENDADSARYNCRILAEKIEQLFAPQAYAKGVNLSMEIEEATAAEVSFNSKYLLQICGNLIGNAIKFTPKGGKVIVCFETAIEDPEVEPHLHITVKDNGTGMEKAQVEDLLSGRSHRISDTEGEIGYGLGFQVVREIIEKQGGRLEVSSELGKGSEFKVILPT